MALKPITDFASQILKPYINNQDKAYAANIAPVETSPATAAHTAGTQLIYNGVLYDVTADIAANDVLATTGAGANISAADKVTEQISAQKQALSDEVETRATLGTHNIFPFVYSLDTWIDSDCTKAESSGVVTYTATGAYARVGYWYPNALEVGKKYVINFKKKCTFSANSIRVQFATTQTMTTSDPSMFKVFEYTASDADYVEETYEFTATSTDLMFGVYVQAGSGTGNVITIKEIQITLATDAKTGYSPYVPTNSQLLSYKDNGVLGAKNLLPLSVSNIKSINTSGTWSGNAYALRGITYTVETNSDGSVADIKVNGTSTATNNDFILYQGDLSAFAGKLLTGRPSGADGTMISAEMIGSPYTNYGEDRGSGVVIGSGIGANCKVFIRVNPSTSVSNQTFYPMVRLASDTDPTYQPYAKTNQELTALVDGSKAGDELSATVTTSLGGNIYLYKKGQSVTAVFDFGGTAPTELGQSIGTVPEKFRPTHTYYVSCTGRTNGVWANADFNNAVIRIDYDGTIHISSKLSQNNLYFTGAGSWFWHE